jgi:hypothetical protein
MCVNINATTFFLFTIWNVEFEAFFPLIFLNTNTFSHKCEIEMMLWKVLLHSKNSHQLKKKKGAFFNHLKIYWDMIGKKNFGYFPIFSFWTFFSPFLLMVCKHTNYHISTNCRYCCRFFSIFSVFFFFPSFSFHLWNANFSSSSYSHPKGKKLFIVCA